jgi:hypothetical protein
MTRNIKIQGGSSPTRSYVIWVIHESMLLIGVGQILFSAAC